MSPPVQFQPYTVFLGRARDGLAKISSMVQEDFWLAGVAAKIAVPSISSREQVSYYYIEIEASSQSQGSDEKSVEEIASRLAGKTHTLSIAVSRVRNMSGTQYMLTFTLQPVILEFTSLDTPPLKLEYDAGGETLKSITYPDGRKTTGWFGEGLLPIKATTTDENGKLIFVHRYPCRDKFSSYKSKNGEKYTLKHRGGFSTDDNREYYAISEGCKAVAPQDNYELNFIWINLDPQHPDSIPKNIFGPKGDITLIDKIAGWAKLHPGVKINIWYDSALVTETAVDNTVTQLKEIADRHNCSFKLKDINKLAAMKKLMCQRLMHPAAPVYFRVDLVQHLIADEQMQNSTSKVYQIITHFDVVPISRNEIFKEKNLEKLRSTGLILGRREGDFLTVENIFMIFNKSHPCRYLHSDYLWSFIEKGCFFLESETVFNRFFVKHIISLGAVMQVQAPPSQFKVRNFDNDDHKAERFNPANLTVHGGRGVKNPDIYRDFKRQPLAEAEPEIAPSPVQGRLAPSFIEPPAAEDEREEPSAALPGCTVS